MFSHDHVKPAENKPDERFERFRYRMQKVMAQSMKSARKKTFNQEWFDELFPELFDTTCSDYKEIELDNPWSTAWQPIW